MEETNNQELMGKLYALRAGLSVISEEADKLLNAEENVVQKYCEVTETATRENGEIVLTREQLLASEISYRPDVADFVHGRFISEVAKDDPDLHDLYEEEQTPELPELSRILQQEQCYYCAPKEDEYEEQQIKAKICYARWLGTGESVQYYNKLRSHYQKSKKSGKGFGIFLLIAAVLAIGAAVGLTFLHLFFGTAIAAVIGIVGFGLGIFFVKGKAEKKQVVTINNLLSYIPTAQQEMKSVELRLAETATGVKERSTEIYTALENEFSKLIDPRDWQYLDLIIFYFETGRAENMKEALQLVEREVQTQRIVDAVEKASECVCKTIAKATSIISSQLRVISSQLGAALKQQEMQNALLAKSSATSERLLKDVKYIKNYVAKK